jgi:hypothetical protein
VVDKTNVDGFLKDFEGWLKITIKVKEEAKKVPQIKLNLLQTAFIWHDDGDYGTLKKMTIQFTDKTKKNEENTIYSSRTP